MWNVSTKLGPIRKKNKFVFIELTLRHIDQLEFSTIGLFLFLLIWRNENVDVKRLKCLFV